MEHFDPFSPVGFWTQVFVFHNERLIECQYFLYTINFLCKINKENNDLSSFPRFFVTFENCHAEKSGGIMLPKEMHSSCMSCRQKVQ